MSRAKAPVRAVAGNGSVRGNDMTRAGWEIAGTGEEPENKEQDIFIAWNGCWLPIKEQG